MADSKNTIVRVVGPRRPAPGLRLLAHSSTAHGVATRNAASTGQPLSGIVTRNCSRKVRATQSPRPRFARSRVLLCPSPNNVICKPPFGGTVLRTFTYYGIRRTLALRAGCASLRSRYAQRYAQRSDRGRGGGATDTTESCRYREWTSWPPPQFRIRPTHPNLIVKIFLQLKWCITRAIFV